MAKLAVLAFQRLELVGCFRRDTSALATVDLSLFNPLVKRLRYTQPIFSAIETTADCRDG